MRYIRVCRPCRLEDGIFITGYGKRESPFSVPGFLRGVRASGRRYVPTRVEENAEIWTNPSNIGRVEKIIYKKSKVSVIFVGDKQNGYSFQQKIIEKKQKKKQQEENLNLASGVLFIMLLFAMII